MRCWREVSTRSAETAQVAIPYGWRYDGSKYPIVWDHGAQGDHNISPVEKAIRERLLCPMIGTAQGGVSTWGSDAVVGSSGTVERDRLVLVNSFAAKAGQAILLGGSMGGNTAIQYALNNPTKVAAIFAAIPAFDLEYIRLNDPGTPTNVNKTAIEGLYGAGTVPAGKQTYSRGADFAALGIPLLIAYSTNDPFTPLASTQAFIAAAGCQSINLGAVGHNYLTVDTDAVADFLAPHVA